MATGLLIPQSYIASGTINPATFVVLDTANNGQVLASGAGGNVWGISQNWGDAPNLAGSTPPAAIAGEPIAVYTLGSQALLTLGAGGATVGAKLKSDASGNGIVTTTSGDIYGATCLQAGAAGDTVLVEVTINVVH